MKKKISIVVMLVAFIVALYFIFFPIKITNQSPPQPASSSSPP